MNLPLETWYLSAAYEPIIRRVAIVLSFAGKGCGWGWMLCCIRLELLQESLYLWIRSPDSDCRRAPTPRSLPLRRQHYSERVAKVVVTAGGLGLAVAERGKTTYAEAAHTVKLVDTHGAGDAFIGALAARWASGVPVAEAVHFANAAAALLLARLPTRRKPSLQTK